MKVVNRCGTLGSCNKASLAIGLQGTAVAGLTQKGLLKVPEEVSLFLGSIMLGKNYLG